MTWESMGIPASSARATPGATWRSESPGRPWPDRARERGGSARIHLRRNRAGLHLRDSGVRDRGHVRVLRRAELRLRLDGVLPGPLLLLPEYPARLGSASRRGRLGLPRGPGARRVPLPAAVPAPAAVIIADQDRLHH